MTDTLSDYQKKAFDLYVNGENVFMTGPGGSGKSELIKMIVADSKAKNKKVHVCALTGCACILLQCNAKTIHSWSGLGICKENINQLSDCIAINKYKKKNWTDVDILIIDEVSMMSLKLFNALYLTGQKCRRNKKPFGGIQVIFSGDFHQLSPVGDTNEIETCQYCFESEYWDQVFEKKNQIPFTKVFRQSDPVYLKILHQIRMGRLSTKSVAILNTYIDRPYPENSVLKPTIIYPTRVKVTQTNQRSMDSIKGEIISYHIKRCTETDLETFCGKKRKSSSEDDPAVLLKYSEEQKNKEAEFIMKNIPCEHQLDLKVGAQVMCISNIDLDNGICNGSQGVVIEFSKTPEKFPIVKFNNGLVKTISPHVWQSETMHTVGIKQVPLVLSWAITIHKSQGTSLDTAEIDIGNGIFTCGQTYVALSRLKSLEGLYLKSFDPSKIKISKKVVDYYKSLEGINF